MGSPAQGAGGVRYCTGLCFIDVCVQLPVESVWAASGYPRMQIGLRSLGVSLGGLPARAACFLFDALATYPASANRSLASLTCLSQQYPGVMILWSKPASALSVPVHRAEGAKGAI